MSVFGIVHLVMLFAIPVLLVALIVLLVQYHSRWKAYKLEQKASPSQSAKAPSRRR